MQTTTHAHAMQEKGLVTSLNDASGDLVEINGSTAEFILWYRSLWDCKIVGFATNDYFT